MNGQLEITYERGALPGYVRDILTAGASRLFLPVGFVEDGGLLSGHFRTEGYRRLSSVASAGTGELLGIVLAILHGVWQTERIYLFSELYEIRNDCIYVESDFRDVRLAFIPAAEETPLTDKLTVLLQSLRGLGSREGYGYIDKAAAFLQEDWGYRALIHRLEELRREVYLCSVK